MISDILKGLGAKCQTIMFLDLFIGHDIIMTSFKSFSELRKGTQSDFFPEKVWKAHEE